MESRVQGGHCVGCMDGKVYGGHGVGSIRCGGDRVGRREGRVKGG
jgi:hypothetical protein